MRRRVRRGSACHGRDADAVATQLAHELDAKFKAELKDYKRVSASVIELPAGRAFFFAYLRVKQGTLNTLTVLPLGKRSYVFSTVLPARSKPIAQEVLNIMRSIRAVSG